jgi:hypothetical protein
MSKNSGVPSAVGSLRGRAFGPISTAAVRGRGRTAGQPNARIWCRCIVVLAWLATVACDDETETPPAGVDASVADAEPPQPTGPCGAGDFDSTYAAIQEVIFKRQGCTEQLCHGKAASGGLDLSPDVAYQNLIDKKATGSTKPLITPGLPNRSYLYDKLLAATEPGTVEITGSPMPNGRPPLSKEHLEVLRTWIQQGAPATGSILDPATRNSKRIAELLGSCLPSTTPVQISPLAPPNPDEGIQFPMPVLTLQPQTEIEVCFAQYFDYSDKVPPQFKDADGKMIFVNGLTMRQDPNSHHLILAHSTLGAESITDPSFGAWACRGGDKDGATCDPLDLQACGSGLCASEPKAGTACIGFGPREGKPDAVNRGIAEGMSPQQYNAPLPGGVYQEIPIRGILYWNVHAFNLTDQQTVLRSWANFPYASDRRLLAHDLTVNSAVGAAAGTAPFTAHKVCAKWVVPAGTSVYELLSHTHRRGSNFTVDDATGARIYASAIYSDPLLKQFTPPLVFNGDSPAERTLEYCADFNNGLREDGTPDVDLVTRSSRMPPGSSCAPIACAAGRIGEPCAGATDDASCDTSPGANDGDCDACAITSGTRTENEMFVIIPTVVDPQ